MRIISWNVAGLRARLKNDDSGNNHLMNAIFNEINSEDEEYKYYDIVCLQETKCEERELKLPNEIEIRYPYRYWNSTKGTSQRKGLSGVCIWCTSPPIEKIETPDFDEEGRIVSVEFEDFILINVYVPNSQSLECERYYFRERWNVNFLCYIQELESRYNKEIIICGDFNVAHLDIDICDPKKKKNKVAGFFDNERLDFGYLLDYANLIDIFRKLNPTKQKSTYWSNFLKQKRTKYNGWGIDYYLITEKLINNVKDCKILKTILGSDHCPIELELYFKN